MSVLDGRFEAHSQQSTNCEREWSEGIQAGSCWKPIQILAKLFGG
jgi:hypothetical protein